MAGLNTCLVIHSQDITADYLLNCKIGTSHVECSKNLSAVRLETTKVCVAFPCVHFDFGVKRYFMSFFVSADAS